MQEISDLIGRYCMLFDDEDWVGLDELWTDDAAFAVEDQAFEGREVLMDFLSHCLPPGYRTKHMIARPLVELGARRHDGHRPHRRRVDRRQLREHDPRPLQRPARQDRHRLEDSVGGSRRPVQYVPGPPPMSDSANGVSGTTMRASTADSIE